MTTWTVEQIRQAQGLRARVTVDAELIARHGDDVRSVALSKMAKSLTRMAHAFAIELDVRDFHAEWSEVEDEPWHLEATMRWQPSTTEVEIRGGHMDGRLLTVQRIGEPIRTALLDVPAFLDSADPADMVSIVEETYVLAGWREDERVWVYESR